MEKVLSLIVPVYNMEKYLRECLESVVLPTRSGEYEVIVVNDGSSDSSLDIANEYAKKLPEIFIVLDKENGGYGSCFNAGIKKATGKYVKMLDSDDFLNRNVFSAYLDILATRNEDIILCNVLYFDDIQKCTAGRMVRNNLNKITKPSDLEYTEVGELFIHHTCFRNEVISKCRCPEFIYYTDTIIFDFGLSNSSSIFSSDLELYFYRINRSGQSVNLDVAFRHFRDKILILDSIYSLLDGTDCLPFILCKMEIMYHTVICSICKQRLSKDNYCEFVAVSNNFKHFLYHHRIRMRQLRGLKVKASLLSSRVTYLLMNFFLHKTKKIENSKR